VGKTSLAKALAGSIEWEEAELQLDNVRIEQFSRIQCTVDLLPQDILGFTRFDSKGEYFVFNKGPIFAHFVLCDEINLLTPKTQGSFFQAMEEQMVTIEGNTYRLPDTFFIIATMNLKGAHLFPLPAPQLDRFMLQVSLGFPDPDQEADIIKMHGRNDAWNDFKPVISSNQLTEWQNLVDQVFIHEDIIYYMVSCINKTRTHQDVLMGASPRTGVKLSRLARALSMIRGEEYVSIDTVKEIFIPAVSHRLVLHDPAQGPEEILDHILKTVPVE
jgi:MoxR-like ATPase